MTVRVGSIGAGARSSRPTLRFQTVPILASMLLVVVAAAV